MRGFLPEFGIVAVVVAGLTFTVGYLGGVHNAQKKAEVQNKELREEISILKSRPVKTNIYDVVNGFVDEHSIANLDEKIRKAVDYAEQLNSQQATQ